MTTKPLALIIEDSIDQSMVFTAALNEAGYETEAILDGELAQHRLTEIIPDLVILDLHIPKVNGDMLLRQIRNDTRLSDITVMLATADAALASNLQPQVDIVLLKPISFTQIMLITKRYMKKIAPGP